MKPDLKTPSTHPSLLPGLSFNSVSFPPPPERRRGTRNGGYGQFITLCLCCSFLLRGNTPHSLLIQHEGPSHRREFSTTFSNTRPSHRLQLFRNCPSVCPSHRVQSFRSRLLQRGSLIGSQVSPANLLCHGVLSPRVHRSWQEPAPVRGSRGHSLLQASTYSNVGSLPWATGGYLLHCGPPWAAGEQPASPWSSAQAAREDSLLRHLAHLFPPPSSLTLVSAELFLSHHLTPVSQLPFHRRVFFFPFFNMLSERHYHCC